MISVTFNADAIKTYTTKLNSVYLLETQKQINLALERGAAIVAHHEAEEMPRDTGAGAANIDKVRSLTSVTIRPKLPYMLFVHEGTKPHMPPVKAIEPWADRHGINPFALAMSIKKKGTKPNRFVPRTWLKSKDELGVEFSMLNDKIASFMAKV